MEHTKELQLEILSKYQEIGKTSFNKFVPQLSKDWSEYDVVFNDLFNKSFLKQFYDGNLEIPDRNIYEISSQGRLLLKELIREKNEESESRKASKREERQGTSRTNWARIGGIAGIIAAVTGLVLVGFEIRRLYKESTQTHILTKPVTTDPNLNSLRTDSSKKSVTKKPLNKKG